MIFFVKAEVSRKWIFIHINTAKVKKPYPKYIYGNLIPKILIKRINNEKNDFLGGEK